MKKKTKKTKLEKKLINFLLEQLNELHCEQYYIKEQITTKKLTKQKLEALFDDYDINGFKIDEIVKLGIL